MKRLNPKTGLPFKRGDIREDGYIFLSYRPDKPITRIGFYREVWSSPAVREREKQIARENAVKQQNIKKQTKNGHIWLLFHKAKHRAKREKIPFNITEKYLLTLPSELCPVFNIKLGWCKRTGGANSHSPSLDKIVPELGYVEGNVQWVSYKANSMKSNATFSELRQFADWINKTIPKS